MSITMQRTGVLLRAAMEYLTEHDTRTRQEVIDHLAETIDLTPEELGLDKNGRPAWEIRFLWTSVGMVKAGWVTKDGSGVWAATPAGRQALATYPDSESFRLAANRAYQEWSRAARTPRQRAWLVRGSSVLGVNLVPEWLASGFCSLAGSQLRPLDPDITHEQLDAIAREDYSHLKHQELKSKVDEIVAFVSRMNVGDVVLTTSDEYVYIGDVTGDWIYTPSEGGRSNLRREVAWRNVDAPVDYAELPTPLPARLQSGMTVLDLTAELDVIDQLGAVPPELVDVDGADTEPARRQRHEHLPQPSAALADELFVDFEWLDEVRDVLDERRQLVFYGPPGTGKTYIAQKLAADLVGPEQVKLVQFHPAYTYEDFFEGYRPVTGATAGTIAFELRAGPFRQLVNRAREHPDQAFVLIVDEINRANLAKVFGELYFLLEYRDQAVDLLYSSDEEGFTLPTNLYLIGTMNTADRSIALLDAAMRRRFAFVELSPDSEPTRSLLARWSTAHGLGVLAADLLAELNRRLDDPDFRIGPSYFMTRTGLDAFSPERLHRIWRTSILPLLQEHYYGQWDQVAGRFRLDGLLATVAATADDEPAFDDQLGGAETADGADLDEDGGDEPAS